MSHGRYFPKGNYSLGQRYPSSGGPYMRQNREQILAKKQILEKHAREQQEAQEKSWYYQQESSNQDFMLDTIPNHAMNLMVSRHFPLQKKSQDGRFYRQEKSRNWPIRFWANDAHFTATPWRNLGAFPWFDKCAAVAYKKTLFQIFPMYRGNMI